MNNRTCLEKEAESNSEMAYFITYIKNSRNLNRRVVSKCTFNSEEPYKKGVLLSDTKS